MFQVKKYQGILYPKYSLKSEKYFYLTYFSKEIHESIYGPAKHLCWSCFVKMVKRFKPIHIHKRAPTYTFDRVLNMPLKYMLKVTTKNSAKFCYQCA